MIQTFALKGELSGELISYGGRVLVHDNPRELQFLFPKMTVVEVSMNGDGLADGRATMPVRDHPQLVDVTWPLDPNNFNLRT
jgi:hypothetical protein